MTEGRPSATLNSAADQAVIDRRVDDEERSLTGHAYGAAREDATAPITHGKDSQSFADRVTVAAFVAIPIIAVLVAIPFAWGWGIGWVDVLLGATFFALTSHGITIGFHRYFTHGSFKANRPLKIALAIAGSLAIEGPLARWVADHRKHHAHSDSEGDPHSPWAYGESTWGLTKGFWHAHIGWFFDVEQTPLARYVPDLIRDRDLVRITRLFPLWVATSLLLPVILGGLLTWSWQGAVTAFFWATLVRVGLVHHVTWSINSVCHVWGKRPFKSRDHSGNVAWLAILSGGESWHNLHHSDPTCARHGVLKWQIDSSARIIELFEWAGWATDVRWPKESRLAARRATSDAKA